MPDDSPKTWAVWLCALGPVAIIAVAVLLPLILWGLQGLAYLLLGSLAIVLIQLSSKDVKR